MARAAGTGAVRVLNLANQEKWGVRVGEKFQAAIKQLEMQGFRPVEQLYSVEIVGRELPVGYSFPVVQDAWFVRFPFLRMTNCVLLSTPETVLVRPKCTDGVWYDAEDVIHGFRRDVGHRGSRRRVPGATRWLLRHKSSAFQFERVTSGRVLVVMDDENRVGVSSHLVVTPFEGATSSRRVTAHFLFSAMVSVVVLAMVFFWIWKAVVSGEQILTIGLLIVTNFVFVLLLSYAFHVLSPIWEFFFRLRHKRPRYAHEADLLNEMKQQLIEELQAHGWEVVAEGYGAEMEQGPDGELKVLSEIRERARGGTVAEEAEEKSDASKG